MKIIKTKNNLETIAVGNKIGQSLKGGDVILLSGDLGAGKTTFTKGIGEALNIKRVINSPTFTIVKEYQGNHKLIHMDLYRLEQLEMDIEEYFNEDNICVCEWPKDNMEVLNYEHISIEIYRTSDNEREIKIKTNSKRLEEIVGEL
ncbi:MAG: tRNA (adenosine(37)-N6)-threonylcarbamoyltransferase complex ATPase subunit type 1 TsaE [bacterium]